MAACLKPFFAREEPDPLRLLSELQFSPRPSRGGLQRPLASKQKRRFSSEAKGSGRGKS